MDERIVEIRGYEVLDSRGTPTVAAQVRLESGAVGSFTVPSGASTGRHEAVELRDVGSTRFGGKGVLAAVEHVRGPIRSALLGKSAADQGNIDAVLCELDGTANKSRIGANAILAVSLACANAVAACRRQVLHEYVGGILATRLPVPMFNVLNGGCHADNPLDVQEFMIAPHGLKSFAEAVRAGAEIYAALRKRLSHQGYRVSVGDEGGFAPDLPSDRAALELLTSSIEDAGYRPREEVGIVLDVAATELFKGGVYSLASSGIEEAAAADLITLFKDWIAAFPILGIEDGLAEDDWDGWRLLTSELGDRVQVIGDDLFVTNAERLRVGISRHVANAIIIKPNQVGTLSETIEAVRTAQDAGLRTIMANRSAESEDPTIARLAVALGMPQIKTGAPCRGERTAKYNELLRIEADLDAGSRYWGTEAFVRPRH